MALSSCSVVLTVWVLNLHFRQRETNRVPLFLRWLLPLAMQKQAHPSASLLSSLQPENIQDQFLNEANNISQFYSRSYPTSQGLFYTPSKNKDISHIKNLALKLEISRLLHIIRRKNQENLESKCIEKRKREIRKKLQNSISTFSERVPTSSCAKLRINSPPSPVFLSESSELDSDPERKTIPMSEIPNTHYGDFSKSTTAKILTDVIKSSKEESESDDGYSNFHSAQFGQGRLQVKASKLTPKSVSLLTAQAAIQPLVPNNFSSLSIPVSPKPFSHPQRGNYIRSREFSDGPERLPGGLCPPATSARCTYPRQSESHNASTCNLSNDGEIGHVMNSLKSVVDHYDAEDQIDMRIAEWQQLARVVDRILFWFFSIITLAVTLILLVFAPWFQPRLVDTH